MSLKLTLQAKTGNWERFKLRKSNPKFKRIAGLVFARDKHTCRYTGYHGAGLEVVNADGDYSNNTKDNLVTADGLAAKCLLLDSYPLQYDGADRIIYLPEMTQAQLLNTCRILFCQMEGGKNSEAAYNAKMTYAQLQDRAKWLDEKTESNLSNPGVFAHYINDKPDPEVVNKCRWLPAAENYEKAIANWKDALNL